MTCPGSLPGFSGRAGISTVFWFPSSGLVLSAAQPCLFRECHLEEVPLRWVWKAMQVSGEKCWEGHSSWQQHVRRLGPGRWLQSGVGDLENVAVLHFRGVNLWFPHNGLPHNLLGELMKGRLIPGFQSEASVLPTNWFSAPTPYSSDAGCPWAALGEMQQDRGGRPRAERVPEVGAGGGAE